MDELIWKQDAINVANRADYTGLAIEDVKKVTDEVIKELKQLPSAQPERKAPMSYKEQLSLDCSFCRQHECGDTLYESANWDGGVGFDYIRDIRFCPICGRKLYGYEDTER